MKHPIILANQKKRLELPLWLLLCFGMFNFWQMGFIYFMGPSLVLNGRTPLPIDMDNVTTLIAAAYVLAIIWMALVPKLVVWTARITACTALLSVLGLFLPLGDEALMLLLYLQAFCCCFLIGFETFLIVEYFSEGSAILHLTVAYGIGLLMIAAVQNDMIPITYRQFRGITVAALILLMIFFFRMPAGKEALPEFTRKGDGLPAPKKLLGGVWVYAFIAALMAVSGPSIAGEITNGVSLLYITDGLGCLLIYLLYKMTGFHPTSSISICISLGAVGYLLMFATPYLPSLAYPACCLIGLGMIPCQIIPLYNVIVMKIYPLRYLPSISIFLALVAVLVQSSMVEMFRGNAPMLYLAYGIIMVILVIIYLQLVPFLLYTMQKNVAVSDIPDTASDAAEPVADTASAATPWDTLTKRELEVVDLISCGYSNPDIAKMLFISEHTVKDHTKNIYRKLEVHSRFELSALVSRQRKQ